MFLFNKLLTISLFITFIITAAHSADAALRYQQDLTLINWRSQEDIEKMVQEFCNAADGDADIKIIDVKYKKRKISKDNIAYEAIITCHVSEKDASLMKIQGKIFQQKHDLTAQYDTN